MFIVKVGETHDLEDECYLEFLESGIALLSGFCVWLPGVCWYSVKDKIAAV